MVTLLVNFNAKKHWWNSKLVWWGNKPLREMALKHTKPRVTVTSAIAPCHSDLLGRKLNWFSGGFRAKLCFGFHLMGRHMLFKVIFLHIFNIPHPGQLSHLLHHLTLSLSNHHPRPPPLFILCICHWPINQNFEHLTWLKCKQLFFPNIFLDAPPNGEARTSKWATSAPNSIPIVFHARHWKLWNVLILGNGNWAGMGMDNGISLTLAKCRTFH